MYVHHRLALAAMFACLACSSSSTNEPIPVGPIDVTTDKGPIKGSAEEASRAFLGIPYAAPPVGPLRFMPPKPAAAWTAARDATKFGPICTQLANGTIHPASNEDCLYLNVYTPLTAVKSAPVFVWIHGGGFLTGAGSEDTYVGSSLAAKTNAIIVTLNYRMGPFGFLSHAGLAKAEGVAFSPSQGLLDQQAALGWVQRNIAAFGGDPANVTVAGESAGATSVCSQIAMPGSKGLFARAVIESGLCSSSRYLFIEKAAAESQGERLATALGCPNDDTAITCMQGKSPADVATALPLRKALFGAVGETYAPALDGVALPKAPLAAVRAGESAKVPVIVGSNLNEGQLFGALWGNPPPSPTELRAILALIFDAQKVDAISTKYAVDVDSGKAFTDALGDLMTCMARETARSMSDAGIPTYLYEFVYPYSVAAFPGLVTTHAFELPFLFRNGFAGAKLNDDDLVMADGLAGYWFSLVKKGDPNAARLAGTLAWPAYATASDEHLVLDRTQSVGKGLKSATCDFWDGILK